MTSERIHTHVRELCPKCSTRYEGGVGETPHASFCFGARLVVALELEVFLSLVPVQIADAVRFNIHP